MYSSLDTGLEFFLILLQDERTGWFMQCMLGMIVFQMLIMTLRFIMKALDPEPRKPYTPPVTEPVVTPPVIVESPRIVVMPPPRKKDRTRCAYCNNKINPQDGRCKSCGAPTEADHD
jgi:hypothetical protein